MLNWQKTAIIVFGLISLLVSVKGFDESRNKKNAFGLTPHLYPLGIFVWGDAVVIGAFWVIVAITAITIQDWILFLLTISVFWAVRSLGETTYWFNQQFSTINRNPPEKLPGHEIFHNDSIWFIYQISMQCVTVVSIILSIYLVNLWVR